MYHTTLRPSSAQVGLLAARASTTGSVMRVSVTTPYYRRVNVQLVHMNNPRTLSTIQHRSSPLARLPSHLRMLRDQPPPVHPAIKPQPAAIEKETLASRAADLAKAKAAKEASEAASGIAGEGAVVTPKKPLWDRIKAELVHYWHGTKLLGKEIKISTKLAVQLLQGDKLTRREQRQLRRTTGDLMRLVPFSVFIIVPFMEFLLPVALKLFPNMLPSTFEDKFAEEEKKRKLLKMRLEMAKFLQETIEESGIPGLDRAEAVKEYGDFFRKVRTTGEQASTEEMLRVARLFHDELTLDNLSRPQLVSMCRYMSINAFGTDNFLRFQIRNKMNSIKRDDRLIAAEGVDSLTTRELQAACQARGIRTGGVSPARLRSELEQWLELNLKHNIPSSLLILSRAFMFADGKEQTTPVEALQATLSSLPDSLLTETELHVSELEGAATPQQKLEVLEQQEELIADEKAQEEREEKARKARKEEEKAAKEAKEAKAKAEAEAEEKERLRQLAEPTLAVGEKEATPAAVAGAGAAVAADAAAAAATSTAAADKPSKTAATPTPAAKAEPVDDFSSKKATKTTLGEAVQAGKSTILTDAATSKIREAREKHGVDTELMSDEQAAAHAGQVPEELSRLVDSKAVADALLVDKEEEEDKARMTEQQLLELREALSVMSSRSAVLEEREELEELKEDRMEYKEDIEELAQVKRQEHKVTRRLGARLEKMIAKLDKELEAYDQDVGNKLHTLQPNERGELTVADIEAALKVIKHTPDAENIKHIVKKLDVDGDGLVLLSHIVELADAVEDEEGTGVLVEGKPRPHDAKAPVEEKKLKKEDIVKDD
ncbi:hypothetical protein DFQ27_005033 [Actinomortierella ambigua]|uniref:Mitochondrial proton/calcium exchanger protein n=1 Tax=Actinomortierella ambigua TaxID=1343610 RepID=A0A9P6Q1P8_9FUNG|nr:hypothetical protein DFQ27_005033 [Actinomortierella ambigua]